MPEDTTLPFIKADARVTVELLSGTIQDLQSVLLHVLDGHSQEDVAGIQEKMIGKVALAGWEFSAVTLTRLLKVITDSAVQSGQVVYRPLEGAVQDIIQ